MYENLHGKGILDLGEDMALKDWKKNNAFGRKHLWTKDTHGYEENLMVNKVPQELKEKGVEENFMVRLDVRVLETFKSKSKALAFAKAYMKKTPKARRKSTSLDFNANAVAMGAGNYSLW
jgi:hypothetical protein